MWKAQQGAKSSQIRKWIILDFLTFLAAYDIYLTKKTGLRLSGGIRECQTGRNTYACTCTHWENMSPNVPKGWSVGIWAAIPVIYSCFFTYVCLCCVGIWSTQHWSTWIMYIIYPHLYFSSLYLSLFSFNLPFFFSLEICRFLVIWFSTLCISMFCCILPCWCFKLLLSFFLLPLSFRPICSPPFICLTLAVYLPHQWLQSLHWSAVGPSLVHLLKSSLWVRRGSPQEGRISIALICYPSDWDCYCRIGSDGLVKDVAPV